MVHYTCLRCGFEERRTHHFQRHLRRKYPCHPKLSEISVEDVFRHHFSNTSRVNNTACYQTLSKVTPNDSDRLFLTPIDSCSISRAKATKPKKTYACAGCSSQFSKNSNLCRHERKCPEKKYVDDLKDLDKQMAIAERKVNFREVASLRQVNIGTTTNNNITNNNTVNIKVLAYKDTDVSHLTDRDYQRALNRASMCIPQILEKVHFDPEKPENHNVVISSMNNKYIKLHDGQNWNLRDREETVEDLFADAEDLLENKLESWQEEENPKSEWATKKYQIYLEVKEKAELYKKIKQELKLLLFNSRKLIIEA